VTDGGPRQGLAGRLVALARRRPVALAGAMIALACGGLWGYFAWWTHAGHVERLYRLSWAVAIEDGSSTAPAQWISPPGHPLIGYYRKELRASGRIRSAWVQVSAPFTFSLYVNGRHLGGEYYKSARATALFDITRYVQPGRNFIAIANTSRTYDETSRIVVAGAITDWQGRVTPIRSDAQWRTLNRYARQIDKTGKPEWFHPLFDDSDWPQAVTGGSPGPADQAREVFPPRLFRDPVPTGWVWGPRPEAEEVFFRRTFRARGKVRDAWLRIAARHSYTLFVNGHRLEGRETGVAESPLLTFLDVYDITPYLGRGRNVIAVKARREALDHGFIADGFWTDGAGTHELETRSGEWKTSEVYQPGWVRKRTDESAWSPASPLRTDTPAAAVLFPKGRIEVEPPRSFTAPAGASLSLAVLAGALLFLALAWAAARLAAPGEADHAGLGAAGPACLPSAAFLALVWMAGYDYRLDPSFSFRGAWTAAALGICVLCLALLVAAARGVPARLLGAVRDRAILPRPFPAGAWVWRHRHVLLLALILVAGLVLRLQHVAFEPIGADEIKMLEKSKGILKLGVPHVIVAQELGVRLSTTSELVHYPMAWGVLLFGEGELALRLPGILFSVFTALLLYRYGQMLHSRGAGLLAAALFSFFPAVIRMSQLARYPAQLTFFTLLAAYFFWRCISQHSIANRHLYFATAAYMCTYVSWEGAGFLLPSLFVGMALMRPRDLGRTLSNPRLVTCLLFIGLAVVLQLNIRAMVSGGLFIYGTGTSELTMMPTWFHSNFDPLYYLDNFFLIENHQVLSWLCLIGLPFAFRRGPLAGGMRFLYGLLLMNLFMKTCFLQIRNWRYIYNMIPVTCLLAAVAVFILIGLLARLASRSGALAVQAHRFRKAITAGVVCLVLLSASPFLLKLYEMPGTHGLPRTRLEDRYYPTIHEAVTFMDKHLQEGDIIISPVPHLVDFYIRDADYFLETILHFQVFLNPAKDTTMHRVSGTQAILSYEDLQKVIAQNRRVWYVTSPLDAKLLDPETHDWINRNMEVVYENIASLVYLAEN